MFFYRHSTAVLALVALYAVLFIENYIEEELSARSKNFNSSCHDDKRHICRIKTNRARDQKSFLIFLFFEWQYTVVGNSTRRCFVITKAHLLTNLFFSFVSPSGLQVTYIYVRPSCILQILYLILKQGLSRTKLVQPRLLIK